MSSYAQFLESKRIVDTPSGIDVPNERINRRLFDFQRDIVRWALRRGRAAVLADCGMGKTAMQLEWANHVPGRTLIVAPLAVAAQTVRESQKFGIEGVAYHRHPDPDTRIVVTNYEMLERFNPKDFTGIVLDESSILKSHEGKFRNYIVSEWGQTPFRLAATATPAPNDFMELGNHSEFLSAMSRTEMLAHFFVHDGGETSKWRLKGHAEADFWRWLCSWAVMIRKPSDLGYPDGKFILPNLSIREVVTDTDTASEGLLFALDAHTLDERRKARKASLEARVEEVARLVAAEPEERWLIWCDLNAESEALCAAIPGAVEVRGSDSIEDKEERLLGFASGQVKILVSKPSIAGHGMNFQCCARMAFTGLSDSYEQFYQAVRRCWRFGQEREVHAYVVTARTEGAVVSNIHRKEAQAEAMARGMVEHMHAINEANIRGTVTLDRSYHATKTMHTPQVLTQPVTGKCLDQRHEANWSLYQGDCVEVVAGLPSDSVGFSVYSPPFASLYTYSNSERDMGNCNGDEEFFAHYRFLIRDILRVTKPGRLTSVHCMNLPTSKARDGEIGIRDFRGDIIRAHVEAGWIYHSEVCIWKDPVTAMQRTKALGLLHKQMVKDSCMSRQGIPDYVCTFRKTGENPEPVHGGLDRWVGDGSFRSEGNLSIDLWQRYASPVWMDINPSRTLQAASAREAKDERHICPLQLDVIERCLMLWSREGDVVLSPFAGIGSEGHVALQMERRFVGVELKKSYYRQACANLSNVTKQTLLI